MPPGALTYPLDHRFKHVPCFRRAVRSYHPLGHRKDGSNRRVAARKPAPPSSRSLLPRGPRSTPLAAATSCMGGEEKGDVAKLSPLENIGLGVAAGALGQRDAAGHTS